MADASQKPHRLLVAALPSRARLVDGGSMKRCAMVLVTAVVLAATLTAQQSIETRLQKAIQAETVSGDLRAALREYERIAADAGSNRRVAAQALVRLAECHRKLGNAEAAKIFERVTREFSDQAEAAAEARTRLAGLRAVPGQKASGQTAQQIWTGEGVDPMGAPSADGKYLSYTDWSTGDLGLRDLATGQNRRLTNTGGWETSGDFAEFSVPSPDGREVAYAWFNDKMRADWAYELRVITVNGTQPAKPRILHTADEIRWVAPGAWTPDGKSLVFVRELRNRKFELCVVTVATGAMRVLSPLGSPIMRTSVSPDGRFIAYDQPASGRSGPRDVFVIGIDGSAPTAIASNPANDELPLWSADGTRLVFVEAIGKSFTLGRDDAGRAHHRTA
jgi:Tol biopolymer transport system component